MPQKPTPSSLGDKLRQLPEQAGLTLYELKARSGIPRSRPFRLENGTTRPPGPDVQNRLSESLEASPEEFYDALWHDERQPLPSLSTYFRSKYHLSDDQIDAVQRVLKRATRPKPSKPHASPD